MNVAIRNGALGWDKTTKGPLRFVHGPADAAERMSRIQAGEYIDLHNWVFTPTSFRILVDDLFTLGMTKLRESWFHDTINHEFYISLGRRGQGHGLDRLALMQHNQGLTSPTG